MKHLKTYETFADDCKYLSDGFRLDSIQDFINKIKEEPEYNTDEPEYEWLLDAFDGYPQQTYIQNDVENKQIIFYEGWSKECWKGAFAKKEYKGRSKEYVLNDIKNRRFPLIAKELNNYC